jgi:hypothetical protein
MTTHADWERERGRREQAAMHCVDAVLANNIGAALFHALAAHDFEQTMRTISRELDQQDNADA